jgi:hypothetical protein
MTIEDDTLDTATEPQKTAYAKLVQRYACAPSHIYKAFCTSTLICEWPFITIGIEPDGYAHS